MEEMHSKELVEVIAKALVDNPEEVVVTEKAEGRGSVIELHVASSDMGKVIGKQGRIAKAIRSVVKAACRGSACVGKRDVPAGAAAWDESWYSPGCGGLFAI